MGWDGNLGLDRYMKWDQCIVWLNISFDIMFLALFSLARSIF